MEKLKETAIKTRQSKSAVIAEIAASTGVSRKDIQAVLESLAVQARRHLKPRACGEFVIHSLGLKMMRVTKPARKARKGRNPFTGEEIDIKAKPASKGVRVSVLKVAKDMVEK